jgi:hypothetical protein
MSRIMKRNSLLVLAVLSLSMVGYAATRTWAQALAYQTYEDVYNNELGKRAQPNISPGLYTYDRVFYHNPAISPYENLMRRGTMGGANYQLYVKPEEEARAAVQAQMPVMNDGVGGYSGDRYASFYDNHFYGGWQNRP